MPYFLFALLCDQYALHLLHQDLMFPPMGRDKNPNPRIQFWRIYFYLYCAFKEMGLVHLGRFHGDIETRREDRSKVFHGNIFYF